MYRPVFIGLSKGSRVIAEGFGIFGRCIIISMVSFYLFQHDYPNFPVVGNVLGSTVFPGH